MDPPRRRRVEPWPAVVPADDDGRRRGEPRRRWPGVGARAPRGRHRGAVGGRGERRATGRRPPAWSTPSAHWSRSIPTLRAGLRRDQQPGALVRPPRPVRPAPRAGLGPDLRDAWEAYRGDQPRLRRRGRRHRPPGRRGAGAGLPPGPDGPAASPSSGPTSTPCTSATPRSPPPSGCGCCPTTSPPSCCRAWRPTGRAASTPQRWADDFTRLRRECWRWPPTTFVRPSPPTPTTCRAARVPRRGAGRDRPRWATAWWWPRSTASSCRRTCCGASWPTTSCWPGAPMARAGRVRGLGLPVAEGVPAYLSTKPEVEDWSSAQRAVGHRRSWTPVLYDTRDDYPLGGRAAAGRRPAGQPDPGRPQPGGQGGGRSSTSATPCCACRPRPACGTRWARRRWRSTPYDLVGTADALEAGWTCRPPTGPRAARLRELSVARRPSDWLADQLEAAG